MILPVAVNAFNLILMKNFFGTVNPALEESAKIDGANDLSILIRISHTCFVADYGDHDIVLCG